MALGCRSALLVATRPPAASFPEVLGSFANPHSCQWMCFITIMMIKMIERTESMSAAIQRQLPSEQDTQQVYAMPEPKLLCTR